MLKSVFLAYPMERYFDDFWEHHGDSLIAAQNHLFDSLIFPDAKEIAFPQSLVKKEQGEHQQASAGDWGERGDATMRLARTSSSS